MKNSPHVYAISGLAVLGLVGACVWWWLWPVALPAGNVEEEVPVVEAAAPPRQAAAAEVSIKHPIEVESAASMASAPTDIDGSLSVLFGRKAVLALFQTDDFPRRFVTTFDNLGREQASAKAWPMNPASGRFTVDQHQGTETISADNGMRYTPYVLLLESVDLRQTAAAYSRLYPQFQQAYEELGYPKAYFNDRMVEVIDTLLATPDAIGLPKVHLPTANGPVQPERPWVLYEFDEPAMQSLSAGQKLLLRMGPVNERRVKARLSEFRKLVASSAGSR